MDQKEALEKINEIHNVIESSNRTLFSGQRMIVMGWMIALIPVWEILTKGMTFGYDFGSNEGVIIMLIHIAFYWILFGTMDKWAGVQRFDRSEAHPLIKKAFSLKTPFLICIFGVMIAFSIVGEFKYIHPVVFILLGLMWSLFGRFSLSIISYIAYSYIFLGLVYIYLTKMQIPNLWVYFVVYNGLTYVLMGVFLKKEQAKEQEALA